MKLDSEIDPSFFSYTPEQCKKVSSELNRALLVVKSSADATLKQMTRLETRIESDISSLGRCLQENISICSTRYAPHEEHLVKLDSAKKNLQRLNQEVFDTVEKPWKLSERTIDDTLLPTLVSIKENVEVIKSFGAEPRFDMESYHQTCDRFLTWKGTEFGLKFTVENGLDDIFDAYKTLGVVNDFYRLFQRHLEQQLNQIVSQQRSSAETLRDFIQDFVRDATKSYCDHSTLLSKFVTTEEADELVLSSWKAFLKNERLSESIQYHMEQTSSFTPFDHFKNLVKTTALDDSTEKRRRIVVEGLLECAAHPLSDYVKASVEPPPYNYAKLDEVALNLEKFGVLLREVSASLSTIYAHANSEAIIERIFKPIFADYVTRLSRMESGQVPGKRQNRWEDFLERIPLAGQLHSVIEVYSKQISSQADSDVKTAKKWASDRVKDAVRASYRSITSQMPNEGLSIIEGEEGSAYEPSITSPHEFVVTVTQSFLNLLRIWEECLANENARKAVIKHFSSEGESEISEEEMFDAILEKISSHVVKKFLSLITDICTSHKVISNRVYKQLLCDSEYLRDALLDLHAGAQTGLDDKIEELQQIISS